MSKTTLFEDFLDYCREDNPQLAKDIQTWIADFFDLPNREISLDEGEKKWINENLSEANQISILGYTIQGFATKKGKLI